MTHKAIPQKAIADFYNKFGHRQDAQAFYEDAALAEIIGHGDFGAARAIFELGCGTGRLAAKLFDGCLPGDCRYRGVDISTTMVELAARRLAPWADRAEVVLVENTGQFEVPAGSRDRYIATYVFDILSDAQIDLEIARAHAMLRPQGLLCVAGITWGTTVWSRIVSGLWAGIYRLRPLTLGGCRPLTIAGRLPPDAWRIRHHGIVRRFGLSSEVVVAERQSP